LVHLVGFTIEIVIIIIIIIFTANWVVTPWQMSTLDTGRLYSQNIILVLILSDFVDLRATVRPAG